MKTEIKNTIIMNIKPYPSFDKVFTNDALKGIFYPLCSLSTQQGAMFHFISSNGMWLDKAAETEQNTINYTRFDLIDGKYDFKGNPALYIGHELAKTIFPILLNDFETHGKHYLSKKTKTDKFIQQMKKKLPDLPWNDFDLDYYLQTFYEFSINKLHYELHQAFGQFNHIINKWGEKENKIAYIGADFADEIKELWIDINHDGYQIIGKIMGSDYFTDGNNSILCYNEANQQVINFNTYS
jgi:hypothetical protein